MNKTLVFAFAGALATALLAAMLLSAAFGNKSKAPVQETLVAARDLPIGTSLNKNNVRWQKWPQGAVPGALIRDKVTENDWKEQKIRRVLTDGEPVTQGALVREVKGSYMAATLEKNMRAVSIDVKAASGVSGFLAPNDRVDVILTYDVRVRSDNNANALQELVLEKASETVLQNLRVLATDQDADGMDGERKAKVSKTVTLEVSKEGAEKLALAGSMGELHLALRQLGDEKIAVAKATQHVTDVTMGGVLHDAVQRRNNLEGGGGGSSVRVYSGNSVTQVPVRMPQGGAQ